MSISINRSSEATTQFNNPLSCGFNTSGLECVPSHSFTSPRHSSTTVYGKKICSHSCLSPSVIEENPKYPIPIKVMSRLKRHNTQAKQMIKQRTLKILNIKCLDKDPVLSKTAVCGSELKNQSLGKGRVKKSKKIVEKIEKGKRGVKEKTAEKQSRERSPHRIKQLIKNTVKGVLRKKKKVEMMQINELKRKLYKKVKLDEMNSKIRLENSGKFKMSKFKPKTPWGIDQRKFSENKETLIEINKQRENRRTLKKSPEYQKKSRLGLSNFLEICKTLGLKRCSSTLTKTEASPVSSTRKKSNPCIQYFIKTQRKRSKEHKQDNIIEEIKKETKRIQNLKKLDLALMKKTKKKKFGSGKIFRTRGATQIDFESPNKLINKSLESEEIVEFERGVKKIASRFSESPEKCSNMFKEIMSNELISFDQDEKNSYSEELEKSNSVKNLEEAFGNVKKNSEELQDKAARIIQRFFKTHFCRQATAELSSSHYTEDNEVQGILSVWKNSQQQDSSPKPEKILKPVLSLPQFQDLEEMKDKELSEVKNIAEKFSQNPDMVESLNKMIGNRYQHIADLLQNSLNYENTPLPLDNSNSLGLYKQELEEAKEIRILDFSFPSYESQKSLECEFKLTQAIKNEKEPKKDSEASLSSLMISEKVSSDAIFVGELSETSSISACSINSESPNLDLVSRSSPVKDFSLIEKVKNEQIVSSAEVVFLSEFILSAIILDVIPQNNIIQLNSVEKSAKDYIDQLVFNISESNFRENLKKPLHKDPLEVLSIMHCDEIGYPEEFYNQKGEPVLSLNLFSAVNAQRLRNLNEEEIKSFQKIHDRLIFDNCNSILNQYRLFGPAGKPMPWECKSKVNKVKEEVFKTMLKVAEQLGKIDSIEPYLGDSKCVEYVKGDVDKMYLEGKIKALIIKDIVEGEEGWIDYRFEDAQAKINAAEIVLQFLVEEVVNVIGK